MNTSLESDLDGIIAPELPKLTQDDYDRAAKLNAGIVKLQIELDALKERIKAEAPAGKSTKVYGKVVVKTGTREDKDVDAMTEKYPSIDYPDFYKPVFDAAKVAKVAPKLLILKPAIQTVSISFAD